MVTNSIGAVASVAQASAAEKRAIYDVAGDRSRRPGTTVARKQSPTGSARRAAASPMGHGFGYRLAWNPALAPSGTVAAARRRNGKRDASA
jgi:hypothetical protein